MEALGPRWLSSVAGEFQKAAESQSREFALDISGLRFVTLFEWLSTAALIESLLSRRSTATLAIDLIGSIQSYVIPAKDYLGLLRGNVNPSDYTKQDFDLSKRVYQVAGFLEALGTRDVLNKGRERLRRVFYPGIEAKSANLQSFYTNKEDERHTVVLGLTRVETKEDCRQFLEEHRILSWRNAMERRFHQSPLFESEEIWRVLCHELAVNIWEHARVAGFIAARVVTSPFTKNKVRPWCRATFGPALGPILDLMGQGFLELCVVDAGEGFVNTLGDSYSNRTGIPMAKARSEDVLAYAFDEFGTSKESDESWVTERHALGRILKIVSKYGGALRLRSSGTEIIYRTSGGGFERIPNHLGYVPQSTDRFARELPGAHLQLILPLVPLVDTAKRRESRSVLSVSLPETFRTQADQVRGHLIPLREELEYSLASIGGAEQRKFRKSCEKLSRKILARAITEPLVLDFSDLNWTPAQFETLLHLLQNVLQTRPVLLVEIDSHLAREVDDLERQSAPTQLDVEEIISDRGTPSNKSFGEISEKLFLETFSRIHTPVLGLDQNGRCYLFGVLDPQYKEPLLSLIDREASIEELCSETYRGSQLKESSLHAILNYVSYLFEISPQITLKELWRTTWSRQALANEASRAMSRHFDKVAERSDAWRGRSRDKTDV